MAMTVTARESPCKRKAEIGKLRRGIGERARWHRPSFRAQQTGKETAMKIVIVTGGSRGLGASTAIECARKGMGVVVTYNSNPAKADDVVKAIIGNGGKAVALKLDVGDISAFPAFRDFVASKLRSVFGRDDFDYLVN